MFPGGVHVVSVFLFQKISVSQAYELVVWQVGFGEKWPATSSLCKAAHAQWHMVPLLILSGKQTHVIECCLISSC